MFGTEELATLSTTMNTLSISSGAAAALTSSRSLWRKESTLILPAHLRAVDNFTLTFAATKSPPRSLKKDEILVSVISCAVDEEDYSHVSRGTNGFIPGRAFCGKAISCGISVDKIKRGDYVYGLAEEVSALLIVVIL